MTAESFHGIAYTIDLNSFLVIYGIGIWPLIFYLIYILITDLKKNWRLLVMLIGMMVFDLASLVNATGALLESSKTQYIAYSIMVPSDTFVHWMFCSMYLKLSIEVKYMFDLKIYTNSYEINQKIRRDN